MSEHTKEAERLYRIVKGSHFKDLGIKAIEAYRANAVMLAHDDAIDTISTLQAQRDELLAALKMVTDDDSGIIETYEAVSAAIANAEKNKEGQK